MKKPITIFCIFLAFTMRVFAQNLPYVVYNTNSFNVNVRTGPSLNNSVITTLGPGKKVVAYDENNGWYKVNIPADGLGSNQYGWVKGGTFFFIPNLTADFIQLTGSGVLIRKNAGGGSSQQAVIWINTGGNNQYASAEYNQYYALSATSTVNGIDWYKVDLPNNCLEYNGSNWSLSSSGWISSQFSNIINGPGTGGGSAPGTPNGLSATPSSGSMIDLAWNNVNGATSYEMFYCNGNYIGSTTQSNHTVSGLMASTNYDFKIKATNSYGSSSFSSCQGATTLSGGGSIPSVPSNFTASPISNNSIYLDWNSSVNASVYEVSYCNGPVVGTASNSNYTVNGLTSSTNYSFKVRAINSNGSPSSFTSCQNATTTNSGGNLPSAPTGLTGNPISSNSIFLSWNSSSGASSYEIWDCNGAIMGTAGQTSFTVPNLLANTTYSYKVKAVNINGSSPFTNCVNVQTNSNNQNLSITGYVRDIETDFGSASLIENALSGATVKLILNGQLQQTQTSSASGYFQFSNILAGSNYSLEISDSGPLGIIRVIKPNVVSGTNHQIKLPKTIAYQIDDLTNDLEALTLTLTDFNVTHQVGSYDVIDSRNLQLSLADIQNDYDLAIQKTSRLYLASFLVLNYYQNATIVGDQVSAAIFDSHRLIFFLGKISARVLNITKSNIFLSSLGEMLNNQVCNLIDLISNKFAALTPQGSGDFDFKSGIKASIALAKVQGGLDPDFSVFEIILQKKISEIVMKGYINKTQPFLSQSVDQVSNATSFPGSFDDTFFDVKINHFNSRSRAFTKKSEIIIHRNNADIAGKIAEVALPAGGLFTSTGVGAIVGAVLGTIGVGAFVIEVGNTVQGVGKGLVEMKKQRQDLGHNINNEVFRLAPNFGSTPQVANNGLSLQQAVDNYNNHLDLLLEDAEYNDHLSAYTKFQQLNTLNDSLNITISNCLQSIYANSAIIIDSIPQYEQIFYSQLAAPITDNCQERIALAFFLLSYGMDSTKINIRDSLQIVGEKVIQTTNSLPNTIQAFQNQSNQFSKPAYLGEVSLDYPSIMAKGENGSLTLKFRNYGNQIAQNVYAKVRFSDGVQINTDSIYVGSVAVNELKDIEFSFNAPQVDTVISFSITLNSMNGNANGIGGAISINDNVSVGITSDMIPEVKVYPNPNDGNLFIEIPEDATPPFISLTLQNIRGSIVFTQKSIPYKRGGIQLNLPSISPGQYFLYLNTGKNTYTKIILLR